MSPAAPSATGELLDVELAARLDAVLTRLVRWSRQQLDAPMAPGMLSALATVVDQGSVRLGDLAVHEHVAPATLSRIVAGLEAQGHLVRDVDPADRRSSFVRASDQGRALVHDLRARRGELLLKRLQPVLSPADQAALRSLVDALEGATGPAPQD